MAYFLKRARIQTIFNGLPIEDFYHANCYEALAYKFIGYLAQNMSFACVCLPDGENFYEYVYEVYFGGDEEEKKPEPEKKKKGGRKKKSQEKKEEEKKQEKKEEEIPWDEQIKLKDQKMTENIILKAEGGDKDFKGSGQEFLDLYEKDYDHEKFLVQQKRFKTDFARFLGNNQPGGVTMRFNN